MKFVVYRAKDYKKLKLSEITLGDIEVWEEIRHVSNQ